jgi:hypothetical protein
MGVQPGVPNQPGAGAQPAGKPQADLSQQLDNGDFAALSGQKLDEGLAESIRSAISSARTVDTDQLGHGDVPFRDIDKGGALLIGFFFTYGNFHGTPTIGAMRPIFLNKRGRDNGDWHGGRSQEGRHAVAKPGYAVGAVRIRAGLGVDSFQIVFMRIDGNRLDPADMYESPWYGGGGGGGPRTLAGDGALIVGIFGKTPRDPKSTFNGMGLITLPPAP